LLPLIYRLFINPKPQIGAVDKSLIVLLSVVHFLLRGLGMRLQNRMNVAIRS